ncbi:MAG: acyl-CoA dehydratase activase [Candidatus Omnitrophica bacterium]|nr:acyl-CoA dehydratase activase [Candidatus Omnitrophota bacterium]
MFKRDTRHETRDTDLFVCGIDVGSAATKCVVLDGDGVVRGTAIERTGVPQGRTVETAVDAASSKAGVAKDEIGLVVSTGYGRRNVPFRDYEITEISAHARGARFLFPDTCTVIDAGGQDCKAIRLDPAGLVDEFVINDRCAAGTGRFLESMSSRLGVNTVRLGELALLSRTERSISNTCTVFAESEIVSLLSDNVSVEEVAGAVCRSASGRLANLAYRVRFRSPVTVSGGVFENEAVATFLEKKLSCVFNRPREPQLVGALGAASFALECLPQLSRKSLSASR